jgi:two-component system nitrogen regulation response regulator GlnG
MDSFAPDVLITDVMLPDGDGLDGVADILAARPDLNVIVLSAQNTLNTAIRATEKGAFEYLPKPFDLNELTRAVSDAIGANAGEEVSQEGLPHDGLPLVGRSPAMQEVYRTIARVLSNDLSILVLGESGTGKELVAEAIHSLGQRRTRPFVAINMAAIPRELIEAELFGYEKGAFTGAHARTAGKFEQAQGGTLFLDEIGDMPMEAQTRLLRVLQSGEVTTVGWSKPVRVNVRIIAATNKELPVLVEDGRFRQDLYYRLNVVPIALPPLRERREDVILLARHFLERAAQDGLPRKTLSDDAAHLLMAWHWPGNVRELQNMMQRLSVLTRENVITADMLRHMLPMDAVPADSAVPEGHVAQAIRDWAKRQLGIGLGQPHRALHDDLLALVETVLLHEVLASVDGNQIRAAAILGINRNTLRKKLTDYNLDPLSLRPTD